MKKESFWQTHPIVKALCLMLVISLAILIVAFLGLSIVTRHGKEYEMPELANIHDLDESNPYDIRIVVLDSIFHEGMAGGTVLSQDPKPHSKIKRGRKVYVSIAAYVADNAVVPDLTGGISPKRAISQLKGVGLCGGKLKFVDSPHANLVLEMTHNGRIVYPGERLSAGAAIDMVVGIGPDPDKARTIVPYVDNRTASDARNVILSASLNVGIEHFDDVSDRYNAVVWKQSPAYTGKVRVPFGSTVELWYCDPDKYESHHAVSVSDSSQFYTDYQEPDIEWATEEFFEDEGLW